MSTFLLHAELLSSSESGWICKQCSGIQKKVYFENKYQITPCFKKALLICYTFLKKSLKFITTTVSLLIFWLCIWFFTYVYSTFDLYKTFAVYCYSCGRCIVSLRPPCTLWAVSLTSLLPAPSWTSGHGLPQGYFSSSPIPKW